MWIYTDKGFISIVKHNTKADTLLVRSRFSGHLEEIFGKSVNVFVDEKADYPYRAEINKDEAAQVIAKAVSDIDYPNFKNKIAGMLDRTYFEAAYGAYHATLDAVNRIKSIYCTPDKKKKGKTLFKSSLCVCAELYPIKYLEDEDVTVCTRCWKPISNY